MDRHVKWLRRRILASIATQTAETFAVVAVLAFVLMQWLASEGPLTSLFGSVVIAQLVAVARIGHAMRSNPLNYVFMRKYVERPFAYRVSRFQGEDEAHAVAGQLPGFAPVATIRDTDADPEPIFDIYHDPSRLVAASVSRASGSISLVSSLDNGRLLITDARLVPPHERIVMSLAADDRVETVIATHRRALSTRSDVVELASSAHQVILDSLALEYDSYVALGPALSPFLDLEASKRSPLRLIARVKPEELLTLPSRLGPDMPLSKARVTTPAPESGEAQANGSQVLLSPADTGIPQVVAPQIAAAPGAALQVAAPQIAAPQMAYPDIVQPDIVAPQISAHGMSNTIAGESVSPAPLAEPLSAAPNNVASEIEAPLSAAPESAAPEFLASTEVAPEPVAIATDTGSATMGESIPLQPVVVSLPEASSESRQEVVATRLDQAPPEAAPLLPQQRPEIAATHFVTVEPDAEDVLRTGEPITAEVPVVELRTAPLAGAFVPPANEPLDLQAALAALPTVPVIDANSMPEAATEVPAPPEAPVLDVGHGSPADATAPVAPIAPAPRLAPATLAPAATLAEAVVAAPDNPAALIEGPDAIAAPALTESIVAPAPAAPSSPDPGPFVSAFTPERATVTADLTPPAHELATVTVSSRMESSAQTAPRVMAPAPSAAPTSGPSPTSVPAPAFESAPAPVFESAPAMHASDSASFVSIPSSLQASSARIEPTVADAPQDLATALGYASPNRPRLSAVLRSNASTSADAKRARRKSR